MESTKKKKAIYSSGMAAAALLIVMTAADSVGGHDVGGGSGIRSSNDNHQRVLRSSSSDFTITCQTNLLFIPLEQTPLSVVRECVIYSFGSFIDPISLLCFSPSSSLSNVDCKMTPASITINNNDEESASSANVTIYASSDSLTTKKDKILINAIYNEADIRSTSIPVLAGDVPPQTGNPPVNIQCDLDLFLLPGQSNMADHTMDETSIGKNGEYWMKLMSQFEKGPSDASNSAKEDFRQELLNVIHDVHTESNANAPRSVSMTLMDEVFSCMICDCWVI